MKFLLNKTNFVWFIIGCSVLSLVSSVIIIGTGDLEQPKTQIAGYFSITQTLLFSFPGLIFWFEEKCSGLCCSGGLAETMVEILFASLYVLTLANIITCSLLDPLFFWHNLTALQRSFATTNVIIVVLFTFLYEIRVFLWCTTKEERRLEE